MTKIVVTNYELQGTKVIAHISDGKNDCTYHLDKVAFEDWLTEGTGVVNMGFTHALGNVLTEVEIKEPVSAYWLQGEEINNSPILEHLQLYLNRDELTRCQTRAQLQEQYLKDLIELLDGINHSDALSSLTEYGMLKQEAGEHSARAIWKKMLESHSI